MKIPDDKKHWLLDRLQELGAFRACRVCGSEAWEVSNKLARADDYHKDPARGARTLPLVAVACGDCGQVVFFSAVILGLVEHPSGEVKK